MFDRISMLVGAGVITVGVSTATLAGVGVAIASTEPAAGGQTSTPDSLQPDSLQPDTEQSRADGFDTVTRDVDGAVDDGDSSADHSGPGDESAELDAYVEAETELDAETELVGAEADTALDIELDSEVGSEVGQAVGPEETDTGDGIQAGVDSSDPEVDGQPDLIAGSEHEPGKPSQSVDPVTESIDHESMDPESMDHESPDAGSPDITTLPEADGPDEAELAAESGRAAEQRVGAEVADRGSVTALAVSARVDAEPDTVSESSSVVAPLPMLSAAEAPSAEVTAPRQTLLSIVGAIVFNLYSFAIRAVSGPPLLPWGSTVTVHSSKLEIDCGDGYEVPADWYVPEGPTPTQLIYLQHGFLAAAPFYSYTAARLAEATHSIVVATSLTSNFLACDGCWVGGSPMHKAVADLLVDGNTALAASAGAAGYGPSLLDGVEKVVLTGHSAGGGLAAGAAGYMADSGTIERLAGVVMLDGVGFGQVMPEALAKLPDELSVYNLAGKAYFWNMNGSTSAALEKEWPGKFNGVRLIGGLHSDTMLGGNPLIQAGLNLATGWSKIENVKAAETLSAAWINDMFAGSPTSPYYGAAGTMLEIQTARGTAETYVMPGPTEQLSVIDVVFQFFLDMLFSLDFATCAAPSAGSSAQPAGQQAAREMNELIELSTPNTALSLDGNAKPGHSVGQHLYDGFSGIKDASQRPNRLQRAVHC